MADVTIRKPVYLTGRQQNMLALLCQHLSSVVYSLEQEDYIRAEQDWAKALEVYLIQTSKAQEWGTLYDIMHRTGENG
jgi:hypothetical protein